MGVTCPLCPLKQTLQNTYNTITKAISLWYIQAGIYHIEDPWYCQNTVELWSGKAKAGLCVHAVLDSISDDRGTGTGLSLRVWPVALGEKAASCSAEKRGDGTVRSGSGEPCRCTSKVCNESVRAWKHSIPVLYFPWQEKSKRKRFLILFDKSLKVLKWKCLCKCKIL